jgi:hypothetical protein
MKQSDILVEILERGAAMLHRTLADFSEADMKVRPMANANHTQWMLGHLCLSEIFFVKATGGNAEGLLPDGFGDCFPQTKERANESTCALNKAELLAVFDKVRARTIEHVKSLDDAALLRKVPSPLTQGKTETTIGFLANMPALHLSMHIGQMQIIRRSVGNPFLF